MRQKIRYRLRSLVVHGPAVFAVETLVGAFPFGVSLVVATPASNGVSCVLTRLVTAKRGHVGRLRLRERVAIGSEGGGRVVRG